MSWHISRPLLLTASPADVFCLAGFHCAVTSPRSVWRLPLALRSVSPTTFYPCGLPRPSPDSLCVFRRLLEGLEEATPSIQRLAAQARNFRGSPLPAPQPRRDAALPKLYPTLSTAPSGNTPVSRKRQSAMSNLRATATIPIRLKRLPPPPKRSRNHTLRALSG
jgi:hypothetical protein